MRSINITIEYKFLLKHGVKEKKEMKGEELISFTDQRLFYHLSSVEFSLQIL